MSREKNSQNKKIQKWFLLFMSIIFIGAIQGDLLGQTNSGEKEMTEEKKYSE